MLQATPKQGTPTTTTTPATAAYTGSSSFTGSTNFQGIGSLTEKEVLYISDFLSWELLGMKKCFAMAEQSQDAEVKTLFQTIGQKHEQNYRKLLQQLH